jgi:DNA-binding NarL/FixJ family response regulator
MPSCATIVLSMHDERIYAERAVRAGARGYVMKRESTKRIVSAIRDVMRGRLCVSDEVAEMLAQRDNRPDFGSPVEALSDRELEVFTLIGAGRETRQIADEMNVSMKTVQAYCARIKEKLRLASATELLREAVRWQERQSKDI